MRLLLLNGNTDPAMTERMRGHAAATLERLGAREVTLVPATARFGARYVASRAAATVAAHAVLDAVAEHAASVDAVALACFGDPGLWAARELSGLPVHGMAEASILAALRLAPRVALLTGGAGWVPMLEEFALLLGHGPERVIVRAVPPAGDALARDPGAAAELLARAAADAVAEGAGAVVLGGAGLAGLGPAVSARVAVPVLDSLDCLVEAAVAGGAGRAAERGNAAPGVPTLGLGAALEAALARTGRPG
ncbi:aspartate/glutamate racemase family protein [Roseomonas sp. BN140053]|uniref:aspartate/glutamate racemase family protein n=1 Tax=Roseomonas sp. BN140053 TaxID=3391898 RepID=UPI0039ECD09E